MSPLVAFHLEEFHRRFVGMAGVIRDHESSVLIFAIPAGCDLKLIYEFLKSCPVEVDGPWSLSWDRVEYATRPFLLEINPTAMSGGVPQ
jgi:hypothetical protein